MSIYQGSRRQQGGLAIYEGSRRQRGGNLFSTIKRAIIPLGQKLIPGLKSTGKDLLHRGAKVGVGALRDKLTQENVTLKDSLRKRTAQAIDKAAHDYLGADEAFLSQDGAGIRRKRRRRRCHQSKRKAKAKPRKKTRKVRGFRRKGLKRLKRKGSKRGKRKTINKVKRRRRKTVKDIFS